MSMSMLVIDGKKYNLMDLEKEKQLEEFVIQHYNEIFGIESLYFDIKPELRSQAGIGSKPDGIVVVFDRPSYYVVEIERAEHGIHDHVITQISKLKEAFVKSKIEGDLYKFLTDLFSSKPVVVIIIDRLRDELEEAVGGLPLESKIVEFKTFAREDAPNIYAHLFEPIGGSSREKEVMVTHLEEKEKEMIDQMESDEIKALLSECLKRLELLHLQMKPLKGRWISVWFKGKRFMYIAARQKFFKICVQKPDGKWLDDSQIRNKAELEDVFKNKIKPSLEEFLAIT
jgi:hypothetical protein